MSVPLEDQRVQKAVAVLVAVMQATKSTKMHMAFGMGGETDADSMRYYDLKMVEITKAEADRQQERDDNQIDKDKQGATYNMHKGVRVDKPKEKDGWTL